MPKDIKQFRKGTKSCVECRQRKLRCILPADDDPTQSCQNCAAKGRHCVLQVHAGRSNDSPNVTSRDRIRQLENSVGKLWSVVRELKSELGHAHEESPQIHAPQSDERYNDDSDSDTSDTSPMNPPAHLQQLFDNEIVDARGSDVTSPVSSSDKSTSAVMLRARNRLQALVPPKEDVQILAPIMQTWFNIYNSIFQPFTIFKTVDELLLQYDGLKRPDASPYTLAAVLLWMAVGVQNAPPDMVRTRSESIKDGPRFVRQVSDALEEVIVTNDTVAGSIEGIEISLGWVRLQLLGSNTKRVWLMLRRCIALAELIGMPRASHALKSSSSAHSTAYAMRQEAAAAVWESICIVDRIAGLMFNLPLGTAAHGFPSRQDVISPDGQISIKAYLNNLARIAANIQEIDDIYISERPDQEIFEKVFKVDQDLRSLRSMTPEAWWSLGPQHGVPEHLMQYWQYYLTIRAHLQLALRNSTDSQCAYSYLTCTHACRELAPRYVKLRSILPLTFFAGRIIDLEAMTAAVFLIYTSCKSTSKQAVVVPDTDGETSYHLAYEIVGMMESVCARATNNIGCDVARKASKAIRKLDELLNQPASVESQSLSLKIPLLGNVNVNRHFKNSEHTFESDASLHGTQSQTNHYSMQPGTVQDEASGFDPLSWSMDLMMDEFPPLADDFFSKDQWFWFTNG